MFNAVKFGKYYHTQSFFHQLNPLTKIISVIIFLILILINNNIYISIFLIVFIFFSLIYTKIPLKIFFGSIKNIKVLILFLLFFNIFIVRTNINDTFIILFKIILLVFISSILTFTTTISSLNYGIERFLSPLKIIKLPVSGIALSISLAIRFIPTIFEQAYKILKSQASRGIDFKHSNVKGKILALSSVLTPMFILSFKRADDLADAMEVRLYNTDKRTCYRSYSWEKDDTIVVIISFFVLLLFIVGEVVFL